MRRSRWCSLVLRLHGRPHVGWYCCEAVTDSLLVLFGARRENPTHDVDLAKRERHDGDATAEMRDLAGLADATFDVVDGHRRADFLVDRRAGGEGVMF